VALIGDRGAVIETSGALIQGVWGNGRIESGLLNVLAKAPDHKLTPDQLDVSFRGAIVLAAYCEEAKALSIAAELPVRGLILASMPAALLPAALEIPIPILVLEGFGHIAMNSRAYKLLITNERREVVVNAEDWDRFNGSRPEIIIPLPGSASLVPPKDVDAFGIGLNVRVVRAPHMGEIGVITASEKTARLPNGLRTTAITVRLESGQEFLLPIANVERLD
jgi:hypothetical protein